MTKFINFLNFIDGKWVSSSNNETFENRNPADWREVIGLFPVSTKEDLDKAVSSARKGFDEWRKFPIPKRGDVLKRVGDIMSERKEELAQLMTREMGKVLEETRGDVQEGIDTAYYAAGEGRRLFGKTVPSELPNKFAATIRRPIGVVGAITPWNFPMAIPTWKIFPALLCGNSVVFKPATDTPAMANRLVEILLEAGLPQRTIQLIHGKGDIIGKGLVEHPGIQAISFTGSSSVGKDISIRAGSSLKRVSLELGGKNAQLVMDDADLDLAVDGVLWGAFGTAGQRCTATSRLILHKEIHDNFIEKLLTRVKTVTLGSGLLPATKVGPLINESARKNVLKYIEIAKEEGGELIYGGVIPSEPTLKHGWFLTPTIFTSVTSKMRVAKEEIFGPFLSIMRCSSLEDGINIMNDTEYGLSSSIYTKNVNSALNAINEIDSGITYVNGPTIGAEAHLPFGGTKSTGNGHREGGWQVYEFYSEVKTIYIDYSGRLQRAQID